MTITSIVKSFSNSPKKLFLTDALGALLTALSLSLLLAPLNSYFGMPKDALYVLSALALGLFTYSFCTHRFVKSGFRRYLAILVCFNSLYLLISIGLVLRHYELLTSWAKAYFFLELLIISGLIYVELKTYSRLPSKSTGKL